MNFWKARARDRGFAAAMISSFPEILQPPEPLMRFFHWQESQGLERRDGGSRFGLIDREQPGYCMYTMPVDPRYADTWLEGASVDTKMRLAPFLRTGGDGSIAALWLDEKGAVQVVHLGSGSGSTMLCTLVTDPIDLLRLLAIGYDEICWPENYLISPAEIHERRVADDGEMPFWQPSKLKTWVEEEFGVTVPDVGARIVPRTADMDEDTSDDPFWHWMRSMPRWVAVHD